MSTNPDGLRRGNIGAYLRAWLKRLFRRRSDPQADAEALAVRVRILRNGENKE